MQQCIGRVEPNGGPNCVCGSNHLSHSSVNFSYCFQSIAVVLIMKSHVQFNSKTANLTPKSMKCNIMKYRRNPFLKKRPCHKKFFQRLDLKIKISLLSLSVKCLYTEQPQSNPNAIHGLSGIGSIVQGTVLRITIS